MNNATGHTFTVHVEHPENPAMAAEVARGLRLLVRSMALSDVDMRGARVTATETTEGAWPRYDQPPPPRPMAPGEPIRVGPVLPPAPARIGKG